MAKVFNLNAIFTDMYFEDRKIPQGGFRPNLTPPPSNGWNLEPRTQPDRTLSPVMRREQLDSIMKNDDSMIENNIKTKKLKVNKDKKTLREIGILPTQKRLKFIVENPADSGHGTGFGGVNSPISETNSQNRVKIIPVRKPQNVDRETNVEWLDKLSNILLNRNKTAAKIQDIISNYYRSHTILPNVWRTQEKYILKENNNFTETNIKENLLNQGIDGIDKFISMFRETMHGDKYVAAASLKLHRLLDPEQWSMWFTPEQEKGLLNWANTIINSYKSFNLNSFEVPYHDDYEEGRQLIPRRDLPDGFHKRPVLTPYDQGHLPFMRSKEPGENLSKTPIEDLSTKPFFENKIFRPKKKHPIYDLDKVKKSFKLNSDILLEVPYHSTDINRPPQALIDFDETISQGPGRNISDPFPGVKEALQKLRANGIQIIIDTVRGDIDNVKEYLDHFEIPYDYINYNPYQSPEVDSETKLKGDIRVDDRAITFEGIWNNEFVASIISEIKKNREFIEKKSRKIADIKLDWGSSLRNKYISELLNDYKDKIIDMATEVWQKKGISKEDIIDKRDTLSDKLENISKNEFLAIYNSYATELYGSYDKFLERTQGIEKDESRADGLNPKPYYGDTNIYPYRGTGPMLPHSTYIEPFETLTREVRVAKSFKLKAQDNDEETKPAISQDAYEAFTEKSYAFKNYQLASEQIEDAIDKGKDLSILLKYQKLTPEQKQRTINRAIEKNVALVYIYEHEKENLTKEQNAALINALYKKALDDGTNIIYILRNFDLEPEQKERLVQKALEEGIGLHYLFKNNVLTPEQRDYAVKKSIETGLGLLDLLKFVDLTEEQKKLVINKCIEKGIALIYLLTKENLTEEQKGKIFSKALREGKGYHYILRNYQLSENQINLAIRRSKHKVDNLTMLSKYQDLNEKQREYVESKIEKLKEKKVKKSNAEVEKRYQFVLPKHEGFEELQTFFRDADDEQVMKMYEYIENDDLENAKKLLEDFIGYDI